MNQKSRTEKLMGGKTNQMEQRSKWKNLHQNHHLEQLFHLQFQLCLQRIQEIMNPERNHVCREEGESHDYLLKRKKPEAELSKWDATIKQQERRETKRR